MCEKTTQNNGLSIEYKMLHILGEKHIFSPTKPLSGARPLLNICFTLG